MPCLFLVSQGEQATPLRACSRYSAQPWELLQHSVRHVHDTEPVQYSISKANKDWQRKAKHDHGVAMVECVAGQ